MTMDRRRFLMSAAAIAAAPRVGFADDTPAGSVLPASVRADFPIASAQTYLNSAAIHPMSQVSATALHEHIAFRTRGGGDGRMDFGEMQLADLKSRFAAL